MISGHFRDKKLAVLAAPTILPAISTGDMCLAITNLFNFLSIRNQQLQRMPVSLIINYAQQIELFRYRLFRVETTVFGRTPQQLEAGLSG